MPFLHGRKYRSPVALASLSAVLLSGLAIAAVAPRDISKQLEYIDAKNGGVVAYGTIESSRTVTLDGFDGPFTVLTFKVDTAVAPVTTTGELNVYVPGAGQDRLSISPPETETRVGEKVLMFLAADAAIREHEDGAYRVHSFAEIFRTQANRKGDVIVIGEGSGSAIENNTKLSDVSSQVLGLYQVLTAADAGDQKK